MVIVDISPYDVARLHAKEVQTKHKSFFSKHIGIREIVEFAKFLGISVEEISGTPIKGRLEIKPQGDLILINPEMKLSDRIKTISHELGHWILRNYYPEIEENKTIDWKERYANSFANEICIPIDVRSEIVKELETAESAFVLINLAKKYGLTNSVFLKMFYKNFENKNKDEFVKDNIWVVAKWSVNKHTHIEPKLRIMTLYYNPELYYVPVNQGLNRLIPNIEWLDNLRDMVEKYQHCDIIINKHNKNQLLKYSQKKVEADCYAVRFFSSEYDNTSQLIILIRINKDKNNL